MMNITTDIVEFFMNENKEKIIEELQKNILYSKISEEGYKFDDFWVEVEKRKDEIEGYLITPEDIRVESKRRIEKSLMDWMVESLYCFYHFYTNPDSIQNLKKIGQVFKHIYNTVNINYIQYLDKKYYDCGDDSICEEDEEDDLRTKPELTELKYIINMPWEDKQIFTFKKVILENISGFNHDQRGSDNLDIILDFNPTYILKENKLSDLVEGLYRIKSHKFDNWYEKFDRAYCRINGEELTIFIEFDHGS